MSPEAQRMVIAEFCGWSQIEDRSESIMMPHGCAVVGYPPTNPIIGKRVALPDYLNDLNAMHEAERRLQETQHGDFEAFLLDICVPDGEEGLSNVDTYWPTIHATAAQRAEALLRAIGKWQH